MTEDEQDDSTVSYDSLLASVQRLGERKQHCRAETRVLLKVRKFLLSTEPSMKIETASKHELMDGEWQNICSEYSKSLQTGRLRCAFVDPEQPKVACNFHPILFCNFGLLCDKHQHIHLKSVSLLFSDSYLLQSTRWRTDPRNVGDTRRRSQSKPITPNYSVTLTRRGR